MPTKLANSAKSTGPILFPPETVFEGYVKTKKSVRIECLFYGTILSQEKIIIDSSAVVQGDLIADSVLIQGKISGNIFCTGKVEIDKDAVIQGKVYGTLISNNSTTNDKFIFQYTPYEIINTIKEKIVNIKLDSGLSSDETLEGLRKDFYSSSFTNETDPNKVIENIFTVQLKAKGKARHKKLVKQLDEQQEKVPQIKNNDA